MTGKIACYPAAFVYAMALMIAAMAPACLEAKISTERNVMTNLARIALSRKRKLLLTIPTLGILVAGFVLTGMSYQENVNSSSLIGGEVHGYVAVRFDDVKGPKEVLLPGVQVFLKHKGDKAMLAESAVSTNQSGSFRIPMQAPGLYELCAEASGYQSACADEVVEVSDHTALLMQHLMLTPLGGGIRC